MQARNDELLDQDLTDWHDGDVCPRDEKTFTVWS